MIQKMKIQTERGRQVQRMLLNNYELVLIAASLTLTLTNSQVTTDIQGVSMCLVKNTTYYIQCSYITNSDARGCIYTVVSGVEGVNNITGTIPRSSSDITVIQLMSDVSNFVGLVAFELERDNSTDTIPVRGNISSNEACPFTVIPSVPRNLTVISAWVNWVQLDWEPPFTQSNAFNGLYLILARLGDITVQAVFIPDNTTNVNMTGLQPNKTYNFSVQPIVKMRTLYGYGPEAFTSSTTRMLIEPLLQNVTLNIIEKMDFEVNLELDPPAWPFPHTFSWTFNGQVQINDSIRTFGYPSMRIHAVHRLHAGDYTVTATNSVFDDSETGAGTLRLNVFYGPEIVPGPSRRLALLGGELSLACVLSVDYKATMASIMWLHPNGSEVFSGPIVRNSRPSVTLNIRETTLEDSGNWTCIVTVEGINVTTANGMVNNAVIGMKSVRISVSSVVIPSEPRNLTVINTWTTWVYLYWEEPALKSDADITYLITTLIGNIRVKADFTLENTTTFNVTGLQPNTTYNFRVQSTVIAETLIGYSPEASASSTTRIFAAPLLRNLTVPIRFIENGTGLVVNLEQDVPASPFPHTFVWTLNGVIQRNDSRRTFGYPSMSISTVHHSDAGQYSLSAANTALPDMERRNGTFVLQVLNGPSIIPGPSAQSAMLAEPLSLVCALNVDYSAAMVASITWLHPNGSQVYFGVISRNNRSSLSLDIRETTLADHGNWTCIVRAEGVNVTTANGVVTNAVIGEKNMTISVTIVVPSPSRLRVTSTGPTWVTLNWEKPLSQQDSKFNGYYIITVTSTYSNDIISTFNIPPNTTAYYVSSLLPSTTYLFTVQVVAVGPNLLTITGETSSVTGSTAKHSRLLLAYMDQDVLMLGNPFSLFCSVTEPHLVVLSIVWADPKGIEVSDGDRYQLIRSNMSVRLNIRRTAPSDSGNWTCIATLRLEGSGDVLVFEEMFPILPFAILPPGPPHSLAVISSGSTWLLITWEIPSGQPDIDGYIVTISTPGNNRSRIVYTFEETNQLRVTDLQSSTTYILYVQSVLAFADQNATSHSSSPVVGMTKAAHLAVLFPTSGIFLIGYTISTVTFFLAVIGSIIFITAILLRRYNHKNNDTIKEQYA